MLACPLSLPALVIYQKRQKPGLLMHRAFWFALCFWLWLRGMLFAVRRVIDSGSITMLLTVQVMMLMR
ncbi:hypothetical protein CQ059_13190 [Brucella pseudogrignonensis]|nr:hypothetical protein CQ059_13190 [Brucella pseudogrignonensis]PRA40263.1 hypothetical protein CQ063_15590 [Brucella pseudogrignonensis]PRA67794.1 hypothetical protein CQ055_15480 [Brucella pseudogrignonensis]